MFVILTSAAIFLMRISWGGIALGTILHFFFTWWLFHIANEAIATSAIDMVYFYVVVATTVGFGDLSPELPLGKIFFCAFIVLPAILNFAAIITKSGYLASLFIKKVRQGMANFCSRKGHNLFIGYIQGQTEILISETDPCKCRPIVMTVQDIEGRVPEGMDWVRADSLSDVKALDRASIGKAGRVIIMTGDDDVTTSICLAICFNWKNAPVTALFNDREKANLISNTCANVTTVVAPSSMLLARAASSRGAEKVIDNLLSRRIDDALQCAPMVIDANSGTRYAIIRDALTKLGVAPIGITPADTNVTNLCPAGDIMLRHGDLIHYVSDRTYPGFDIAGNPVTARSA